MQPDGLGLKVEPADLSTKGMLQLEIPAALVLALDALFSGRQPAELDAQAHTTALEVK